MVQHLLLCHLTMLLLSMSLEREHADIKRGCAQGTRLVACPGASEPRNLGYMERLGLWGEGTPSFAAFQDFLDAVGGRGVGALELVAMDMKARGMFVCRTLSFQGAPLLLRATAPCGIPTSQTFAGWSLLLWT